MRDPNRYQWPRQSRMWRVLITGPQAVAMGGLRSLRGDYRRALRAARYAKGAAAREREAQRWAVSKLGRALRRKRLRPEFKTQTAEEIRQFYKGRKERQRARRTA